MPDQKFTKLNLGFLNTAQDSTNIKEYEAVEAHGLDPDEVALQTLSRSKYLKDGIIKGVSGLIDKTSTTIGGTEISIVSDTVFYDSGATSFNNSFGIDSAGIVDLGITSENQTELTIEDDFSGLLSAAAIDAEEEYTLNYPNDTLSLEVTLNSASGGSVNTVTHVDGFGNTGAVTSIVLSATKPWILDVTDQIQLKVLLPSTAGSDQVNIGATTTLTALSESFNVIKGAVTSIFGVDVVLSAGIYDILDTTTVDTSFGRLVSIKYSGTDSSEENQVVPKEVSTLLTSGVSVVLDEGTYTAGDTADIRIESNDLPDGDYSYVVVFKATDGGIYEADGGQLPTRAASASSAISIRNFDDEGLRVNSRAPIIELPTLSGFDAFLYRRDEGENDYFQVDLTKLTSPSANTYIDTLRIVEMDQLNPLDISDESEDDFNVAIKNPSKQYTFLFSKDNRLFRVPSDRKDLLLYSRPAEWWGWQRENSFAMDDEIIDFVAVRDPTTVGGSLTLVVFTLTGIYHLTGSGIESDPYTLSKQITDIEVEPNSVVNMNGVLMFTTKSSDGSYNRGSYGQKIYEYDLQNLVEVSARIQTDADLALTAGVDYAEMLGGDKYVLQKTGGANVLIYHRDAQGWITTNLTTENNRDWNWKSKDFTTTMMQRFKIGNARKFKLDFIGDITITFDVWFGDEAAKQTFAIPLSSATRQEVTSFLPHIKGSVWNFKIEAVGGTNPEVYNMWIVS